MTDTNDNLSAKAADRQADVNFPDLQCRQEKQTSGDGKAWLADRYTNRISHRAPTKFEQRNPRLLELHYEICASWPDAHAAILRMRERDVSKADTDLLNARARLKRAQSMKPPKEAP